MLKTLSSNEIYHIITKITNAENDNYLSFLRSHTKELLDNSFSTDTKINETLSNIENLQSIWKQVLIDSICFLRINDFRERAFLKNIRSGWIKNNKTSMYTTDVDKVASLNAYGIEELYNYFKKFTEFESTLYGTDVYYRDHVQHPLLVWLIGLNFLKEYGKNFRLRACSEIFIEEKPYSDPLWKQNSNTLKISTAELAAMWTVAALTHDLGYPLEKVDRVNDQLEQMLNQFGNIGFNRSTFSFQTQHDHLVRFLLYIISSNIIKSGSKKKNMVYSY